MALRRSLDALGRFRRLSAAGLFGPFQVLGQQRELLYRLLKRDIAARTSGALLGGVWLLAQPALQVLSFWFLLDFVLRVRAPGKVAFVDYFLTGMLPWLFVSEIMTRNLSVLNEFGALYQRTVFPLKALPLLPVLAAGIIYAPTYAVVAGVLAGPLAAVSAGLIMCGLLVWVLPACYLLAVLGLFIRELRHLFPFLLTMVMYLTPILYSPDMLPPGFRALLVFNPFADVVALIHSLLHGPPATLGNLLRPLLCWALLLGPAWVLFHRAEPHMREVL